MSKKILSLAIILVVGSFFLISCTSKEPADVAIKAAETAVNATKAEAAKIVPSQVKALEVSLAVAREKFAKGDYKATLEEVTALTGKINEVLAAAKAKKEEMTKKWMDLDQGLSKMLEDIQSRVDVLAKTKKYDWADKALKEYIRQADEFVVPETPIGNIKSDAVTQAVYKSYLEQRFWPVAVAYKLTGKKKYAEKLALLMNRLSAPNAYPTTLHANSQGIPQEGGFWEGIARSYDLIKDAGVLTEKDKELIEQTMRLYIYTTRNLLLLPLLLMNHRQTWSRHTELLCFIIQLIQMQLNNCNFLKTMFISRSMVHLFMKTFFVP